MRTIDRYTQEHSVLLQIGLLKLH